jgi:phage major head subunit gpT-like protein
MTAVTGTGGTRANFSDLLAPGLREVFFQTYSEVPTMHDKIFHVLDSSKQQEVDSSVSGFGQLVETGEGAPVTYEDAIQGYSSSYVHKTYKKGFKITKELYEDAQYNVINRMPSALAKTTTRTVETLSGDIFDSAFTSGTGGDGQYLCATEHPRKDGGTAISNKETHGLTETYLTTCLLKMRGTVDDKGQKILVKPDTLLIPPALELTANILMKSTGRTATNYNEVNPYESRLNIMVWDYLDATQAWFALDSGLHQLNFFWRARPTFGQDESFDTDVALYKTRCRFSVGFSDWRGVWGSTGTE